MNVSTKRRLPNYKGKYIRNTSNKSNYLKVLPPLRYKHKQSINNNTFEYGNTQENCTDNKKENRKDNVNEKENKEETKVYDEEQQQTNKNNNMCDNNKEEIQPQEEEEHLDNN